MESERRLTTRFRSIDLGDSALGQSADAESHIQTQRAGRNRLDRLMPALPHAHNRALPEGLFDLAESHLEGSISVGVLAVGHWFNRRIGATHDRFSLAELFYNG